MSCPPNPCDLIGINNKTVCNQIDNIFNQSPKLAQIYTSIYAAINNLSLLSSGTLDIIKSNISIWIINLVLALILPWVILIIIILFILAHHRAMGSYSYTWAIIISIFIILYAIAIPILIIVQSDSIADSLVEEIKENINNNWEENRTKFLQEVTCGYLTCKYCQEKCDYNVPFTIKPFLPCDFK